MVYYPDGSKEDEIITQELEKYKIKEAKKKFSQTKRVSDEEETEKSSQALKRNQRMESRDKKKVFDPPKKRLKKFFGFVFFLILLIGGFFFYKTSDLFSKISINNGSIFGGLFKDAEDLEGAKDGRINIVLIGMRGQNIPGGSLLADTIMVISVKPEEDKVAMISIPRDLYVEIPGKNYARKINEAHVIGEEEGKGRGLELMKQTVGEVTGLPIHYAISANFNALRDTVDVLGGINIYLPKPFYEGKQFVEGNECGGEFSLPSGNVTLSGEKALCYSRARFATSDFDRARRQQEVLLAIKDKALSLGTLADFSKVNDLIGVVGDNIRTDMQTWEMQKIFGIFKDLNNPQIYNKVLDNSKGGLLYSTSNGSYILLPIGDNYEAIHQVCRDIFSAEEDQNAGN